MGEVVEAQFTAHREKAIDSWEKAIEVAKEMAIEVAASHPHRHRIRRPAVSPSSLFEEVIDLVSDAGKNILLNQVIDLFEGSSDWRLTSKTLESLTVLANRLKFASRDETDEVGQFIERFFGEMSKNHLWKLIYQDGKSWVEVLLTACHSCGKFRKNDQWKYCPYCMGEPYLRAATAD